MSEAFAILVGGYAAFFGVAGLLVFVVEWWCKKWDEDSG